MTSPDSKADAVADRLRNAILAGELAAGTDLPGERELAAQLGVSRLTLRAALQRLEAEGLVRPMHGSGNRVLDWRETGGLGLLGHLAAMGHTQGAIALFHDVLELRRAVAVEAVGRATERATAGEIAALAAHVAFQETLIGDPPRYIAADLTFARMVSKASHNVALVFSVNTIVRLLEVQPGIEVAFYVDPQGTLATYRKVVSLIEGRDAAASRTFTRRLLTRLDRRVLKTLSALAESQPSVAIKESNHVEL